MTKDPPSAFGSERAAGQLDIRKTRVVKNSKTVVGRTPDIAGVCSPQGRARKSGGYDVACSPGIG